ncbi:hypothetical protein MJT46_016015 [Ovis ammon polii x Ovis aries]|nr:hypothetical protein MJT46_016015 [Ovis ammon polii x Ovis aries]
MQSLCFRPFPTLSFSFFKPTSNVTVSLELGLEPASQRGIYYKPNPGLGTGDTAVIKSSSIAMLDRKGAQLINLEQRIHLSTALSLILDPGQAIKLEIALTKDHDIVLGDCDREKATVDIEITPEMKFSGKRGTWWYNVFIIAPCRHTVDTVTLKSTRVEDASLLRMDQGHTDENSKKYVSLMLETTFNSKEEGDEHIQIEPFYIQRKVKKTVKEKTLHAITDLMEGSEWFHLRNARAHQINH